jgi:hypothetical protein
VAAKSIPASFEEFEQPRAVPDDAAAAEEARALRRAEQGRFSAGDIISFEMPGPQGLLGWLLLEDPDRERVSLLQATPLERCHFWPYSRYGRPAPCLLFAVDRLVGGVVPDDIPVGVELEIGPCVVRRGVCIAVPAFSLSIATYVGSLQASLLEAARTGMGWPGTFSERFYQSVETTRWMRTLRQYAHDLRDRLLAH